MNIKLEQYKIFNEAATPVFRSSHHESLEVYKVVI